MSKHPLWQRFFIVMAVGGRWEVDGVHSDYAMALARLEQLRRLFPGRLVQVRDQQLQITLGA